jgi:hypothetical protein
MEGLPWLRLFLEQSPDPARPLLLRAIFEEAIKQDFVQKGSARNLILPNCLREPDKTSLNWDQLRLELASVALRDRILLTLDLTGIFRRATSAQTRWLRFGHAYAHRQADCFTRASCATSARPRSR